SQANWGKGRKKGFNSIVILVAWQIWKHRNACSVSAEENYLEQIMQLQKSLDMCYMPIYILHAN
ncbi:hypothetical protein ACJX0J_014732, partial [Zea mays]